MTVLVDTGVVYADHDTDAARHDAAAGALDAVYDGEFGQPYVSDYLYDEAVTLALTRSGSFEVAHRLGRRLRGVNPYPEAYRMLDVTTAVFEDSVDIFESVREQSEGTARRAGSEATRERFDDQQLSFTDATTVALARRHGVDGVLSFDDDFDGLVERIDPVAVAE